jgi:uncharacterized protein YceK
MKMVFILISIIVIISGCATASYKSREAGFTNYGYEENKIDENKYSISYYGAKSDSYEKLEEFWHMRAKEVCHSTNYQANVKRETYEGKTFILLPPFVYYDNSGWPLLKGELTCNA